MAKAEHRNQLRRLLMRQPMAAADLLASLGVSQPTFSRLWAQVEDGVALGATRARRYALRRDVPGVTAPIPVFQVSATGQAAPIGQIEPLQDNYYVFTPLTGAAFTLFQGLPYFLHDLRPQGFLGRMEPGKNPELDLPVDILHWTDDQVLKYAARRSEHAPGNLILGNESYARYLADTARAGEALVAQDARAALYPQMAEHAMQGEPPGSSAGGEQPKFTATVQRGDVEETVEHVIVKFSPRTDTPSGRRWGDLLVCEHLALAVLAEHRIAAARTSILEAGGRVFLEVVRFDRIGLYGRLPMATFAALDGDLGMMDQGWTRVARELERLGKLNAENVRVVEVLDLYGALIGNTDKHLGNIALAWTFDRRHALLDAYDMLPMMYRPNAHGEIVPRAWVPNLGAALALTHLPLCYRMAHRFWTRVLEDERISPDFRRDVAAPHLATLRTLEPGAAAGMNQL